MKKTFKKLFAALLAAALVLAMAVPAFAVTNTGDNGSITINGTVSGETYTIYRMFTLDSYNGDHYSYTVENDWKPFFQSGAEGSKYITLDDQGHPTWKTDVDSADNSDTVAALAKAALDWAKEKNIHPAVDAQTSTGSDVTFSKLDLGYYLVDSSLGALCGLNTTKPNVTITEKNEKPTIEKKILYNNGEVNENTAKIGDTVNYQVKVNVKAGAKSYNVTDTMSKGLTYDPSSLKVNGEAVTDDIFETNDYSTAENGITTITLKFKDSYIADKDGQTITLTYSATLNKDAVIDGDGNTNEAKLNYGNKQETTTEKVTTKSFQFDLVKIDGADNKLLDGADFTLSDGDETLYFVKDGKGNYRVAKAGDEGATSTIAVKGGKVNIYGLAGKTYTLTETKAPDGYNKLVTPETVDLTSGSKAYATIENETYVDGGVVVKNNAGTVLPSTGGMGTTLFYVIGGGLMVAAVVLLVTKKRMEHKN